MAQFASATFKSSDRPFFEPASLKELVRRKRVPVICLTQAGEPDSEWEVEFV